MRGKNPETIFIVDDDDASNLVCSKTIKLAGFEGELKIFLDGQEAIEYLVKNKNNFPDMIFLDINMPRMDGWDFLEEYEELGNNNLDNVVIVMLTASVYIKDHEKAKSNKEISDFVMKPLTVESFKELIARHFSD